MTGQYNVYDELPRRGQPKKEVLYRNEHRVILRAILWHFKQGAVCTDESIWEQIVLHGKTEDTSPSGARTRRHELEYVFKLIVTSNVKGKTRSGKKCNSYRLTDKGLAKAHAENVADRQRRLDTERAVAA